MLSKSFWGKKRLIALFALVLAASMLFRVFAADVYSEKITPNKLTIEWADKSAPNVTIDTFRIRGYNVAQLRTMVDVCGGTVIQLSDKTYQIVRESSEKVKYAPIGFSGETTVKVQFNVTPIRNTLGSLFTPAQPGWVFLVDYSYNWCSVRDALSSMDLEIQSYSDDPGSRTTHVIIGKKGSTPTPTLPQSPTPTTTLTQSPTPSITPSVTPSPTEMLTPSLTPSITPTPTDALTPTDAPTPVESPTPSPNGSPSPTDVPSPTDIPSLTPTDIPEPTDIPDPE